MEIIIEIPQDINKLCRTCMTIIEGEENKNTVIVEGDEINNLCRMLKYVTDMKISASDGLPIFMCKNCVNKLQVSYIFKKQCESTYLSFKEFISSDTTKLNESKDNRQENENFTCLFCSQSFLSLYKLSRHAIQHYENQPLLTTYLANRNDDNCFKCPEIDRDVISLIEERKTVLNLNIVQSEMLDFKHVDLDKVACTKSKDQSSIKKDVIIKDITVDPRKNKFESDITDSLSLGQTDVPESIKMCDLCDRIFPSELRLSLHFVNHALLAESDTDPNIFDQYIFCPNCGETFDEKDDLKVHIGKCSVDDLHHFECLKCALIFDNELNLLKHEKFVDHNGDYFWDEFLTKSVVKDFYCCPVCTESFSNKNELHLHSVTHVVKKILCRICRKLFCTQVAYNNHLRSHPKYKHVCDLCGKWLGSKHALKMHVMGVHSASRNYICAICSKGFKTPGRLYIHKLTHKEDKKFICSFCAYGTNNIGDFKVHTRIHTSERPYKCNFVNCTKRFKTSSHLNEHIQRHLQIKRFQCNMCEMVFGHSHTLKMHVMVHTGEKPFSCELCKAKFRRKHHLKNHMKQHSTVTS